MKKFIDYYCKYCKKKKKMKVTGPAPALEIYWLRCTSCSNSWKAPMAEVENLVNP